MQPVVVPNAARRVLGRKWNGHRLANHSSYKKLTVPVNAKRFPSPPAPLPEFLDLAKDGVSAGIYFVVN
jgi:hypothetical protein